MALDNQLPVRFRFTLAAALTVAAAVSPVQCASAAGELEEIVVTAQKREQAIRDVPLTVVAFEGQELEREGIRDIADVINLVPGASQGRSNSAGTRTYQIRGVASYYGESTVGYYLDEAAYTILNRNYAPVARTFDIERVEVLKGPQGTLYGLGSMGGTIRFITADPDLQRFRVRAGGSVSDTAEGGDGNYFADLAVSVPVVKDRFAIRGVVSYEEKGGFAESPSFPGKMDQDVYEVYRVKALLQPTARLRIKAGYQRSETTDTWGKNYLTADPATLPAAAFVGESKDEVDYYTGYVSYDLGPALFESSTGYIERKDAAMTPLNLGPLGSTELDVSASAENLVQEFRLVSQHGGPWQWVIGGIYQGAESDEEIETGTILFPIPNPIPPPPVLLVPSVREEFIRFDSESWAVFGELSRDFLDGRLTALVGLRYFRDEREFNNINSSTGPLGGPPGVETDLFLDDFDSLNPRLNLSYDLSDDKMVYVNIAKGFRSGSFNSGATVIAGGLSSPVVEPDKIWSYEVGAKLGLLDNSVLIDISLYYFDWSKQQLNYSVGGFLQASVNAGKTEGQGIDYSVAWRTPFIDGLTLQATGNFNDTTFEEIDDPAAFAGAPLIREGAQLATVPEHNHTVAATYTGPVVLHSFSPYFNGSFTFTGRQGDLGHTELGDEHTLLRLRAGLRNQRWGVYVFADNVLGDSDVISASGSGEFRYYPRVAGLEIRADF